MTQTLYAHMNKIKTKKKNNKGHGDHITYLSVSAYLLCIPCNSAACICSTWTRQNPEVYRSASLCLLQFSEQTPCCAIENITETGEPC
jgi:hypothetical protein